MCNLSYLLLYCMTSRSGQGFFLLGGGGGGGGGGETRLVMYMAFIRIHNISGPSVFLLHKAVRASE